MIPLLQLTVMTPFGPLSIEPAWFPYLWALAAMLGVLLVAFIVWRIIRAKLRRRYQTAGAFDHVVMLVTVPKESSEKGDAGQREKTLQEIQEDIAVMEGVFSAIGGLIAERGMKAATVGRLDSLAFEIVADDGIVSFYIAAPKGLKDFIEQQVHTQYPLAQIEEVSDYNIFQPRAETAAVQLKLKREGFFPVKTYKNLESDPMNAITNALAKVDKEDGAAVQIVVRSAKKEWRNRGIAITRGMQEGKKLTDAMKGKSLIGGIAKEVSAVSGGKPGEPSKEYRMSPKEEEMIKSIEEKVSELGLDVTIRIVASAKTKVKADSYIQTISSAFTQYNIPQYGNSFERGSAKKDAVIDAFILRRFDDKRSMVLTGPELAGIYHMPLASTETPNIRWLMARKSAPPANLPKSGLLVGFTEFRGQKTDVFMKQNDRMRHMYIIGKSGSGKSEYIANLAAQDIKAGYGVCVVDPHGDLVETVLGTVPKERADDVIIFDPSDLDRPIAMNMLESPNPEMTDFAVGEMIAIFYKLFPPEMIGPMFEHHMRNIMLTLMSDPENPGTIAEIPRMITDAAFQKKWVAKVTDPVVRSYWENEVAKTSDFHKSEMFGYLTSKVGRFVENAMMRNIIGQQRSAFDFRKVMDEKKIFLVNLSKGKIGDVNANLLGLIIVTKLQMAVMSRASEHASERKDFLLYIDEFQNFITPSIATILSEARKYRLGLIVAHQYMGQLAPKGDTEIRDAVLGNVGTMMIGRIGIEDAEVLAKEFEPVFTPFDLVNVEKFSWNSKILVDDQVVRPFNIKAYPPVKANRQMVAALKQLSRLKFGRDRLLVEMDINERMKLG